MKTITYTKKLMLSVATVLAMSAPLVPTTAHAIPTGLYYMISPASCQPASSADASKLTIANGGWTYKSNQFGATKLVCPINFSGNTTSKVNTVILSYRDDWVPVTSANDINRGFVEANLYMRDRSAPGSTKITDAGTNSPFSTTAALSNPSAYGYDVETVQQQSAIPTLGKIYYLEVIMNRPQTNGNLQLAFTGYEIRF